MNYPTDEFRCTRCHGVSAPGVTLTTVAKAGYLVYECPSCNHVDLREIAHVSPDSPASPPSRLHSE